MLAVLPFLVVVIMSFQVFPAAMGVGEKKNIKDIIITVVILSLTQAVMFLFGHYLGSKFMYLLRDYSSVVLFVGFFIIGLRMIMDVFKVRKGERTYELNDERKILMAAIVQSVNTFLAGLLFYFVPQSERMVVLTLFFASVIMAGAGNAFSPNRTSLSFASFLYLIGGIFILGSSIYFIFAAL